MAKQNKFPQIKKDVNKFLTSEEGKINKKDVSRIAMTILALGVGLSGITTKPDPAQADCTHTNHGSHGSHSSHSNGDK